MCSQFSSKTDVCRAHPLPLDRLTSILISRFLFDLQAAKQKSTGMASSTGSRVESAVFDRGGYRYHGRVKALAEGAREGGLTF